jgi:hypothetical protein
MAFADTTAIAFVTEKGGFALCGPSFFMRNEKNAFIYYLSRL